MLRKEFTEPLIKAFGNEKAMILSENLYLKMLKNAKDVVAGRESNDDIIHAYYLLDSPNVSNKNDEPTGVFVDYGIIDTYSSGAKKYRNLFPGELWRKNRYLIYLLSSEVFPQGKVPDHILEIIKGVKDKPGGTVMKIRKDE